MILPGAGRLAPAHEAVRQGRFFADKLHSVVIGGVSTRKYEQVVPELAQRCGVSRSAVSRQFVGGSLPSAFPEWLGDRVLSK
ncbi:MAG: hypothetical protein COZ06_17670 [Armatimonadetes bacterium CG_4_10_14_3_um_filter_66_18]|nr:MAG: hypothetical protein AUJ96_22905 [Armatimonadetes bacterium CG2_30_66_41]PIU93464.1 MAG: hypothetical protein COS65_12680 [Armatimonadetes bacterium CG06_land_8_20_14_3_00_66_21]PIX42228.1 MAG: hypothetical protein COZ57_21750 [Armatimonadetes bacterium CG_4_8_14_3_um_filter_66_20]PIY47539.1 MAG: hypothetical protein COZ06_17670 [Armatimonadetes bacterium CG_4_10_14_3_um_filter_66_18]PIZ37820.1 MAG: hypothetical protein COY42_23615 [Armatimonadetes bacterium CG_4_10_14_0_8_um_filter_66_